MCRPQSWCFLRINRDLIMYSINFRSSGKVLFKAIGFYKEIIDKQWNSTPSDAADDGVKSNRSNIDGPESPLAEALYELSEMLEANHGSVSAMSEGFGYLSRAAGLGHVKAQHRLAVAYSTGLYGIGLVPMNAGKALLLEYMAALGGSPEAAMGMGNRYLYGIGVPENCETAKDFYEFAANVAADQIRTRGLPVHSERIKISEADVASASNRKNTDSEVVDYYKHLVSGGGDSIAAHTLGGMYLHGSRFVEQDFQKALYYLGIAATAGDPAASGQLGYLLAQQLHFRLKGQGSKSDTNVNHEAVESETLETGPSKLKLEIKKIIKLLRYASNREDVNGLLGMGYMQFAGLSETADDSAQGSVQNITFAFSAFSKVQVKHADAGFYMGEILMGRVQQEPAHPSPMLVVVPPPNRRIPVPGGTTNANRPLAEIPRISSGGPTVDRIVEQPETIKKERPEIEIIRAPSIVKIDPVAAMRAYAISYQRGNLLALHRIGHMAADGIGIVRSCSTAVNSFKTVAERGDWAHGLTKAHKLLDAGDRKSALALFSTLAAIGIESAQFNTAYLLMKSNDLLWLQIDQPVTTQKAQQNLVEAEVSETGDTSSIMLMKADPASDIIQPSAGVLSDKLDTLSIISTLKNGNITKDISAVDNQSNGRNGVLSHIGVKANCEARALALFAVSASQISSESFLRVGDCFYYGCGGLVRDRVEAAAFYQLAADLRNTHAIFNLGIMHEVGDGVQQDFHLAKRFYDMAATIDLDARLPRTLALMLLNAHKAMQEKFGVPFTDEVVGRILNCLTDLKEIIKSGVSWFQDNLSLKASMSYKSEAAKMWEAQSMSEDTSNQVLQSMNGKLKDFFSSSILDLLSKNSGRGDMVAFSGLLLLFIFIVRWRKRRREGL